MTPEQYETEFEMNRTLFIKAGVPMKRKIVLPILAACFALTAAKAAQAPANSNPAGITSCLINPKRVVQLGSPISGLLSDVLVDRGAAVKAGQVVARLESSVEEAQLEIDRFRSKNTTQIEASRVELEFNEKALAMREQLRDNMFAKAEDVDRFHALVDQGKIAIRKAESDQHIAELEAVRSERLLRLKQIRSSVNGVVTERKLSAGEHVYEQTPILTIAEIDPLFVELVVDAGQYRQYKTGMTADVNPAAPVGGTYAAKVDVVDPVIDPGSNTFRVRLVLPNPKYEIPAGVRCAVKISG